MKYKGIALALLLGFATPLLSYADVEIKMDETAKASVNPYTTESPTDVTQDSFTPEKIHFRLVNSSGSNMNFVVPDLGVSGMSFMVPAKSTRELELPKSMIGYENARLSYRVEKLPDPVPPGPQYEDWKQRISDLIARQKVVYSSNW